MAHESMLADLHLNLRPGRQQDGEALHVLISDILQSYGLPMESLANCDDLNDVAKWYGDRNGLFEALEDSCGELLGCYGVFARSATICELRRLYLVSRLRHRGLGRVLLNTVLGWSRNRGFDSMELLTAPALQGAVRLYERFGFVRVAEKATASTSTCNLRFRLQLHGGNITG